MEIVDLLKSENVERWIEKIKSSHWNAASFLCNVIADGTIHEECGKSTMVMALIDGEELISFCTLADFDDVQPTCFSPWIGFVYTFEKHRKKGYAKLLIDACCEIAKERNDEYVYISTNHVGLYERYGFDYYRTQKNIADEDTRIYRKRLL